MFLEISQNSQEIARARVSFLIKLQALGLQLVLRKLVLRKHLLWSLIYSETWNITTNKELHGGDFMWALRMFPGELDSKAPENGCHYSIFNFIDMLYCLLLTVRLKCFYSSQLHILLHFSQSLNPLEIWSFFWYV